MGLQGDAIRALTLSEAERAAVCEEALQGRQSGALDPAQAEQLVSKALIERVGADDVQVMQRLLAVWQKSAQHAWASAASAPEVSSERAAGSRNQGDAGASTKAPSFSPSIIRQAFESAGTVALQRACMHHFLDWLLLDVQRLARISGAGQPSPQLDPSANELTPHIQHSASVLHAHLTYILKLTDYLSPAEMYPAARNLRRQIHLHIGPTNSGKTYGALLALTKAQSGVYAGPLRLLAHEVFERINEGLIGNVPPRPCNLRTGEEVRVVHENAALDACTVEMVSLQNVVDVAVVDEIQMIGDPQRGAAWTAAVLGLPAKELHLCGEASVLTLIRRLAAMCDDDLHVHTYNRLTPLRVAEESLGGDLSKIEKGDCIVTFARSNIFFLKKAIEQRTGLRCAVAYGALPPETRSEQARRFNDTSEHGLDVMVASDAIGMGLNLKIKRVIFEACSKWDGTQQVALSVSQIKQIAGRAGRYGTQEETSGGAEPLGGVVTTLNEEDLPLVHAALDAGTVPIRKASLNLLTDRHEELSAVISSTNQVDQHLGVDIWSDAEIEEEDAGQQSKECEDDDGEDEDQEAELAAGKSRRSRRDRKEARQEDEAAEKKKEEKPTERTKIDMIMNLLQSESLSDPKTRPAWFDSSRTVSTIMTLLTSAVRFDPTLFFLPSLQREHAVSPILETCSRGQLTIEEKTILSLAPANTRDERVVLVLSNYIRSYGRGELVKFEDSVKGLEMLEKLAEVEAASQEERERQNMARQAEMDPATSTAAEPQRPDSELDSEFAMDNDEGEGFKKTKSTLAEAPHPVLNLASLLVLESLHRCLVLYMWLSLRFVLHFADSKEVRKIKNRTELAIEQVLAKTRFKMRGDKARYLPEMDLAPTSPAEHKTFAWQVTPARGAVVINRKSPEAAQDGIITSSASK